MATYYWVGGSGTWDTTTATNWSLSSGGSGSAGVPTMMDDVIFNSSSNAVLYTVTISDGATCRDWTVAGPLAGNVTLTPPPSGTIYVFGSMTLAATGITWTNNFTTLNFAATTTGKTVTFGTAVGSSSNFTFDGVGGGWTLGAALSATVGNLTVSAGSLNSGNFNISTATLSSSNSNVRSITLGTSTLSLGGNLTFTTSTNLTLSAASSTISLSSTSATFAGGGLSFGTVTLPANWASSITGANTFANLTITAATTSGSTGGTLAANQTVTGTFTASGTSATQRCKLSSGTVGTQYTITAAAVSLSDVDFLDIVGAGVAAPFTGTRLGNLGNNSGITFATKTVYWSLVAGGNWNATAWATSSGGTPDVLNFPLAQDTATIDTTGLTATNTITLNVASYALPNINVTRTTAWTLACGVISPVFYGNVTLNTNTTTSGTGVWNFVSRSTQTLTSNGVTIVPPITAGASGNPAILTLGDALTNTGSALTVWNLNLNGFSASCTTLAAGQGSMSTTTAGSTITVTGSGASAASFSIYHIITGNLTISLTSASAKTVVGGNNSGGLLTTTINQGGSGALTITGAPAIYGLTNTVQPATVSITSGTALTVQNFALTGTAGNLITVNAVTAASAAIITRASTGISSVQYCAFQDITSTNANLFARNSTNTSGNTGITFLTVAATTFYWVPAAGVASGTWDATTTTNWATSSGGAAGAGVPTIDDNVVFDANSNVTTGAFTVTVGTKAWCKDLTISGLDGAMTLAGTGTLGISGSTTIPTTNVTRTFTGPLNFVALTTGKTVSIAPTMASATTFDGVGGGWTLSSALTTSALTVASGTFSTSASNFALTVTSLTSNNSNPRTISLNASAVALGGNLTFTVPTNLTFNAGTSTITNSTSGPTINGGGVTFYNFTFSVTTLSTATINGANTFNNLTFTAKTTAAMSIVSLSANQTVNGTLTFPVGTTAGSFRYFVQSGTLGTSRTITAAAVSLTDVDFRDITGAGAASPFTGTRLGNAGGNSGITFGAGVNKYFVGTTSASWSASQWATSSGGSVAAANFPLPQDTCNIDNSSLNAAATLTLDQSYNIGSLTFANRTNTIVFATGTTAPIIYGSVTYAAPAVITSIFGTGVWTYSGRSTQVITSNGLSVIQPLTINAPASTVQLADNFTTTQTTTLTQGTLDLNNRTLTALTWSSSNSNTRSILFGTGKISLNGSGVSLFAMSTATNFSYTGTPTVEINNATATTSTVNSGSATESQALNFNIISGSYILTIVNAKNVNFTGFTGSLSNSGRTIYGNLTLVSGMSVTAGTSITTFGATSGTQQITSATQTLDFPVTIDGIGGTVQLVDALTVGATRAVLLTNGTFDANGQNVSIGTFASTVQGPRTIAFGSGTWSVSGATFNVSNTSGMTVTGAGILSMTSASAKAFTGGYVNGKWPTLRQAGAGALTVTANAGGVYFANMTNNTQPATVTYTVSLQYIYDAFSLAGTSGNLITINSSTSGTKALLNLVSGRVASSDYLSIQDSYAEPTTTTWYAGANSTNVSGNVGWIFTAAPSIPTKGNFFLVMS